MNGGYVLLDFDKIVGTHDFSTGLDDISEGVEITEAQAREIHTIIDYAVKHGKLIKTHFRAYDGCDVFVVNSANSIYYDNQYSTEIGYIDTNDQYVKRLEMFKKNNKYYIGILNE